MKKYRVFCRVAFDMSVEAEAPDEDHAVWQAEKKLKAMAAKKSNAVVSGMKIKAVRQINGE